MAANRIAVNIANKEMVWNHGDVLGLDVGNVCSVRLSGNKKSKPFYAFADEGVYTFLCLYVLVYGGDHLMFCSRINGEASWVSHGRHRNCWVVNFLLEGLGVADVLHVPDENIKICKSYYEKGPLTAALAPRAFIDDHLECLASVQHFTEDVVPIYYNNVGGMYASTPEYVSTAHHSCPDNPLLQPQGLLADRLLCMHSWLDLAIFLGLPCAEEVFHAHAWACVIPPWGPPSQDHVLAIQTILEDHGVLPQPRQPMARLPLPRQPSTPPRLLPAATPKMRPGSRSDNPIRIAAPRPVSAPPPRHARKTAPPRSPRHRRPRTRSVSLSSHYDSMDAGGDGQGRHPAAASSREPGSQHHQAASAFVDDAASASAASASAASGLATGPSTAMQQLVKDSIAAGVAVNVTFNPDGSTTFNAAVAAPPPPPAPRTESRWESSRGTKWYEKKRRRAELHNQASSSMPMPQPQAPTTTRVVVCVECRNHQPSSRCSNLCCTPCCLAVHKGVCAYQLHTL